MIVMMDWIEFYAVSAIVQPCNGVKVLKQNPGVYQQIYHILTIKGPYTKLF